MRKFNGSLLAGAVAVLGATVIHAHDDGDRARGRLAYLQGVWMSKVTIRDCATGNPVAGPFSGLVTFHEGGTIQEVGPALPNSTRSIGHGTWKRTGHDSFRQRLIFQRYDLSGVLIGTQVITATPVVSRDSQSYVALGGTFEIKDVLGTTIANGCSSATGIRFH